MRRKVKFQCKAQDTLYTYMCYVIDPFMSASHQSNFTEQLYWHYCTLEILSKCQSEARGVGCLSSGLDVGPEFGQLCKYIGSGLQWQDDSWEIRELSGVCTIGQSIFYQIEFIELWEVGADCSGCPQWNTPIPVIDCLWSLTSAFTAHNFQSMVLKEGPNTSQSL